MESAAPARAPEVERFLADVRCGLGATRKWLAPKWLYDERGCRLYEIITRLPEYYLTRTEIRILERHADEMAEAVGEGVLVFEYGVGSARKTLRLLGAMRRPAGYLPVEIARPALLEACNAVRRRFPDLPLRPVWADFTEPFDLPPAEDLRAARRLAFFPGSTVGNFDPSDVVAILRRLGEQAREDGLLLVGVDLEKDAATLERAYDDARGVTAAFDLNLLVRMNRELGADFRLAAFRHLALWDPRRSRVEMHLESLEPQEVRIAGERYAFRAGETIHTESSYKWQPRAFDALAAIAGWRHERTWTDERAWFAVKLYRRLGR
jgi:dimethylhistidine N-methyltransferase